MATIPPRCDDLTGDGDGLHAPRPGDALWLSDLIAGLRGRRNLDARQKLLMELAGKVRRTVDEERQFQVLALAEDAASKRIGTAVEVSAGQQADSDRRTRGGAAPLG